MVEIQYLVLLLPLVEAEVLLTGTMVVQQIRMVFLAVQEAVQVTLLAHLTLADLVLLDKDMQVVVLQVMVLHILAVAEVVLELLVLMAEVLVL
jgi:hypothetical protein